MLAACRWISGCKAVESSAGSTTSVIGAKTKPGVSWNVSVSSCHTRSMRMSVARRAVRISPPARRFPRTSICFPTSLTRMPSSPLFESAEAGMARGLAECGFDQVTVQPDLIASLQCPAAKTAGMEERFRVGVHGLQPGEERLAV